MFESIEIANRVNWKLRFVAGAALLVFVSVVVWALRMTQMPLKSYSGPLRQLSPEESDLR